jgi:hypothetical protein
MECAAQFIETFPNASNDLLYVASAFRLFLSGKMRLTEALGLKQEQKVKIGRPPVPREKELAIARLVVKRTPVETILNAIPGTSRKHVEEMQADYRALNWDGPSGNLIREISEIADGRLSETRRAQIDEIQTLLEERAGRVSPYRRQIIIEAMGETITLESSLPA